MGIKKQYDGVNAVAIMNTAVIEKHNDWWHFRMWLPNENKMYRKTLGTKFKETAIEKAEETLLDIRMTLRNGKKIYSLTCKEGVEKYLAERKKDIGETIKNGRYNTMVTHLNHFLNYIGENTKLKNLDRGDCLEYREARKKMTNVKVKPKTVTTLNEQATINSMIKFLFEEKEVNFPFFKFKKPPKLSFDNLEVKRQTFSNEEWMRFVKAMRKYTSKENKIDPQQMYVRKLIQHYILIQANTGLRTGEQRQLQWADVEIVKKNGKTFSKIDVRAETSKVQKARTFYARNGQYFERLRELQTQKVNNGFVFSIDGTKEIANKVILKHFFEILELAQIEDYKERGIVPYSLRHFCITQRLMAGAGYREVANMCGTSVYQIEKVYWHLNEDVMFTTASKEYKLMKDGTLKQF
jgi:integrase